MLKLLSLHGMLSSVSPYYTETYSYIFCSCHPGCRSWPLCRNPQSTIREIIAKPALMENAVTFSLNYSERPVWFYKLLFSFLFATPVVCSNAFPQEAEPELYSRSNSETRRQAGPHFWKLTFNFNCSFPRYFGNYSSVQTEQERKRSRSNVDFKKPWALALVYHLVFILNIAIKTKQTLSACLLYISVLPEKFYVVCFFA